MLKGLVLVLSILCFSCTMNRKEKGENRVKNDINFIPLSGRSMVVFDRTTLYTKPTILATDYISYLHFLNDSVFIEEIVNCCAPTQFYYLPGTYKQVDEKLRLHYSEAYLNYSEEFEFGAPADSNYIYISDSIWIETGKNAVVDHAVRTIKGVNYIEIKDGPWVGEYYSFMLGDKGEPPFLKDKRFSKAFSQIIPNFKP